MSAAIQLHTALPLTGGKVGASVAWRKSVDSAVGTIWGLLGVLRRTYGDATRKPILKTSLSYANELHGVAPTTTPSPFTLSPLPEDPAVAAPLALDRLRCILKLLVRLLS